MKGLYIVAAVLLGSVSVISCQDLSDSELDCITYLSQENSEAIIKYCPSPMVLASNVSLCTRYGSHM